MNKIIKVVVSLMLLSSIFLYNTGGVLASKISNSLSEEVSLTTENITNSDYLVEVVKETSKYQKYKFIHKKTNEIEYLTVEETEDGVVYTATSDKGEEAVVTRKNNFVKIEEKDKAIQYIDVVDESFEPLINRDYIPAVVPNPGQGEWYHYSGSDHYGEHAIDVAFFTAGVGIVIAIATGSLPGAAVVGSATTIVSLFVSLNVENFWYIKQTYWDRKPNSFNRAYFTKYYAYPDYTNYAGSLWAE